MKNDKFIYSSVRDAVNLLNIVRYLFCGDFNAVCCLIFYVAVRHNTFVYPVTSCNFVRLGILCQLVTYSLSLSYGKNNSE